MPDHVDIQYEAAAISPAIEGDTDVLLMDIDKGRVAVAMRQTVRQGLYAELRPVLGSGLN